MGKNDVCCVLDCNSRRSRCPGLFFSSVPMGKSKEQSNRRRRWIDLIRRKDFIPTVNSKVCGRHFVLGRSSSLPTSVDYYPSKHLGYPRSTTIKKVRTTNNSLRTVDTPFERDLTEEECLEVSKGIFCPLPLIV